MADLIQARLAPPRTDARVAAASLFALTPGALEPSRRFRWAQHADLLVAAGFRVQESCSRLGAHAPANRAARLGWLAGSLVENLGRTLRANAADIRFLQRSLTATLCTWEPLLKPPFVFDVDDAIFLQSRWGGADRICRAATLTVCGNSFLADHFSAHGEVRILPTAVDTARFTPGDGTGASRRVLGWSGSSSGLQYLHGIEDALCAVLERHPDVLVKVVCDQPPRFARLPKGRVVYERWSEAREVAVLQEFTVGLMPLPDDLWARGKCSYKMLTYMAVGVPVVVSPVGMNAEVLRQGPCGFGARNADEWVDALSSLLAQPSLAADQGRVGRRIVKQHYDCAVVGADLARMLAGLL